MVNGGWWMDVGRTPQGVRGLKFLLVFLLVILAGRTPQGVRGLKLSDFALGIFACKSHSARSAWIEISMIFTPFDIAVSRNPHGVCRW